MVITMMNIFLLLTYSVSCKTYKNIVVALNAISTNILLFLLIFACYHADESVIDIALIYATMSAVFFVCYVKLFQE